MKSELIIISLITALLTSCGTAETDNKLPNIILIMADDIGLGDISCFGSEMIHTPNIDQLAEQGIQFNNYYTAGAVCAPTRYSVLTGRYPLRTKEVGHGKGSPWDYLFIETDRMTLGSLCQQMGYKTASVGKWHLGYGDQERIDWGGILSPGPNDVGFDYHWGVPRNHSDRYRCFIENNRIYGLDPAVEYQAASGGRRVQGLLHERLDDQVDSMLTSKTLDFIRAHKDEPFFVYFTPCAAHTHVTPGVRFRGSSKAGQYGDYVQELDYHVGEVMDLLDELGLSDNTLVVFTSDNGGQLRDVANAGQGLNLADESFDVGAKARTPKIMARKMGHLTNLYLREGKASPYEGGFRVPFIIRWPAQFEGGQSSLKLINSADFLATFADLFQVELPHGAGEDSFSFLDVLTGAPVEHPREHAALLSRQAHSYVEGEWKLIDFSYSRLEPQEKVELYNLKNDPAETMDLSLSEIDVLKDLSGNLKRIVEEGHSRPLNIEN